MKLITFPPMDKVIGYPEVADVIAGGFDGSLQPRWFNSSRASSNNRSYK